MKEYSRIYLTVTQTDQAIEEWEESVDVGYICALVFCALVFATFCIAPNVYWLVRHFSQNRAI